MTGVQTCALPICRRAYDSVFSISAASSSSVKCRNERSATSKTKHAPPYHQSLPDLVVSPFASEATPRVRTPVVQRGHFCLFIPPPPADKRAPGVIDPGGHASTTQPCWHHLSLGPTCHCQCVGLLRLQLPRSRSVIY